jgi:tRNA threonylcarbamoyladenosine biosynthesis protein TsaB
MEGALRPRSGAGVSIDCASRIEAGAQSALHQGYDPARADDGILLRILAIDTALEACSAAVLDSTRDNGLTMRSLPMLRGHAEALMPLIAAVMSDANVEFAELDRIAVTVGPGSFTGLRVGVAAARAIALASGKPAVGLTTLAALAAPYYDDGGGAVMSVIDARHDRVYMQLFSPGGRSLVAPRIATTHIATHAALSGPTRIVGNAVRLIQAAWPAGEPAPVVSAVRAPDIGWVARLGAVSHDLTSPVRPLYLSEADARPQEAGILPRR